MCRLRLRRRSRRPFKPQPPSSTEGFRYKYALSAWAGIAAPSALRLKIGVTQQVRLEISGDPRQLPNLDVQAQVSQVLLFSLSNFGLFMIFVYFCSLQRHERKYASYLFCFYYFTYDLDYLLLYCRRTCDFCHVEINLRDDVGVRL